MNRISTTTTTAAAANNNDDHPPLPASRREQEILDLTGGTQAIENSHINDTTRADYIGKLVLFMMWLFDNAPDKLVSIGALQQANQKDIDERARRNNREANRRGRRKRKRKTESRNSLRAACKEMLECMDRTKKNSPICLTGDHALGYREISDFMNTKKKVVSVEKGLADQFVGSESGLASNAQGQELIDADEDGNVQVAVRLSDSIYTGIQSAIAYLYRQSGIERPQEIKDCLSLYCKGSKRRGRKLKQNLGLKLEEGKKGMKRQVYSKIAELLFQSKRKEHIFAHVFLVLDW